jgi:signal transduction histidine kinase
MPHAVCWAAAPRLVWTMVVTNLITFLSYTSICVTLLLLVRKTRRVIAWDWAWFVVGFALFIVACGSTHLLEAITTWIPIFWVDAWTNIITAVLSATVAVMLMRRVKLISYSINDYADRLSRTEAEKQQMYASLLSARKLEDWSRLSTSISHEISNPLEAIQNLLYLIRSSPDASAEVVQLATSAADEADRVITISRSTLTFFRQGAEAEALDLEAAVKSVFFVLQATSQRKHVVMKMETGGSGSFDVRAFAGEARQVLLNLVRNSIEATPDHGAPVTVKLEAEPDGVRITVADQGAGIEPERLPEIFHFGSTTKGEEGNGMGLWTVKHIVTRHGGWVAVKSALGLGTAFTLWWPRTFVPPVGD